MKLWTTKEMKPLCRLYTSHGRFLRLVLIQILLGLFPVCLAQESSGDPNYDAH